MQWCAGNMSVLDGRLMVRVSGGSCASDGFCAVAKVVPGGCLLIAIEWFLWCLGWFRVILGSC